MARGFLSYGTNILSLSNGPLKKKKSNEQTYELSIQRNLSRCNLCLSEKFFVLTADKFLNYLPEQEIGTNHKMLVQK